MKKVLLGLGVVLLLSACTSFSHHYYDLSGTGKMMKGAHMGKGMMGGMMSDKDGNFTMMGGMMREKNGSFSMMMPNQNGELKALTPEEFKVMEEFHNKMMALPVEDRVKYMEENRGKLPVMPMMMGTQMMNGRGLCHQVIKK